MHFSNESPGLELLPLLGESQLQCHSRQALLFASTHFGFSSASPVSFFMIGHNTLCHLLQALFLSMPRNSATVNISPRQPRPIGDKLGVPGQ